jgi:hypothetical protein
MSRPDFEQLWREFPETLPEFEVKFPDEAACRIDPLCQTVSEPETSFVTHIEWRMFL